MNEATAKLLYLLVHEILWPTVKQNVRKHRLVVLVYPLGQIFV